MNVSWNYYVNRRSIDVPAMLNAQRIENYDGLVSFLASIGVDAPASGVVAHYFIKEPTPPPTPEIKKPTPRKRPPKQSVRASAGKTKAKAKIKAKADEQG